MATATVSHDACPAPQTYHTIWLNDSWPEAPVPDAVRPAVDSWRQHHPDATHMHWDGVATERLLSEDYPSYRDAFVALETETQRSDLLRLLVLHKHGGTYVDVDVVCKAPQLGAWARAGGTANMAVIESPLFCEMLSTCYMSAVTPGDPFWLKVADEICASAQGVRTGTRLSAPAARWMHLPLLGWFVRCVATGATTGPGALERTICRLALQGDTPGLVVLAADRYYRGDLAVHEEHGGWFGAKARGVMARLFLVGVAAFMAAAAASIP